MQKRRRDLFFLHAGVVEAGGGAVGISAPSGTGKSTTVWALFRDGLQYVSDELLPVEPCTLAVHPYPRALCLKAPPGPPYDIPEDSLAVDGAWHIPIWASARVPRRRLPLRVLFFLRRGEGRNAGIRALSSAEAAAHLCANSLNALAHRGYGLDAALSIVQRIKCYELIAGSLSETSATIRTFLGRMEG